MERGKPSDDAGVGLRDADGTSRDNVAEKDQGVCRMRERVSFEREIGDLEIPFIGDVVDRVITGTRAIAAAVACRAVSKSTKGPPTIGFEFDLNYGASTVAPPLSKLDTSFGSSVYVLDGKKLSPHRTPVDGFRLEGDGNRIEIATKPFELTDAGLSELRNVMASILKLVDDMAAKCRASNASDLGYPATVGKPRWVDPGWLQGGAKCVVPLGMSRRKPYFRETCHVAASPQATLAIPLAGIDRLVNEIRRSEDKKVPGVALSGPRGFRAGVRSEALYHAQRSVNASRARHLRAGKAPDGTVVNRNTFSPTLQGLLILMVSYLRTSEITYSADDYEKFAKAYLPLNVKHPFRLLFADLTADEKAVFRALYDSPRSNLFALAKDGGTATASDGGRMLFPARVSGHQGCYFSSVPTWNDFVDRTVKNNPLTRTKACPGVGKKGEGLGCEVLFAPLSSIVPYELGSRRVIVEMRRLGFNWVVANRIKGKRPGWTGMTTSIFKLARRLQS